MRGTGRRWTGGVAIAVLMASVVSPAAAAEGDATPEAASPAASGVEDGRPTPLEDLAERIVRRDRDDHARSRALRTLIEERWGTGGVASLPRRVEEGLPADTEYEAIPAPAGDLDGDGAADVLVSSWTYPGDGQLLQALRGSDGAELWRVETSFDDAFAMPAGADLTGDGREDVLAYGIVDGEAMTENDCLPYYLTPCSDTTVTPFEYVLSVRSGADGSLAWTHRYAGVDRYEFSRSGIAPEYGYAEVIDVTNGLMVPYLSGDHDGDGGRDLVLNLVDMTLEYRWGGQDLVVAGEEEGSFRRRYTTRSFIASGADGTTREIRLVEDAPRIGELRPADDGGSGLLWIRWTYPDTSWHCTWTIQSEECSVETGPVTGQLDVLDADTLETRWERSIERGDGFEPVPDLDGDGVAEIFVGHWSFTPDNEAVLHGTVVDGADGTDRWSRPGHWWPTIVPSADGQGADVVRVTRTVEGGVGIGRAERLDGATGAVLDRWQLRRERGDASSVFVNAQLVGDLTGDGTPEIAWLALRLWNSEPCGDASDSACWVYRWRSDSLVRVDDGATGAVLTELDTDGFATAAPAGDLDGDGREDLLLARAGEGPLVWAGLGELGGHLQERWRSTYDVFVDLWPAGDQHGTGGEDLLGTSEPVGSNDWYAIAGVDGRTGSEAWARRYG